VTPTRLISTIAALLILLLAGCVSRQTEVLLPWTPLQQIEPPSLFQVIDYQTKATGDTIPGWVEQYNYTGVAGIEAMSQYKDRYIFVDKNTGTNFNALNLWSEGWSVAQDFALLVASRVQARLMHATSSYPDYEFGDFFGAAVKAAADADYPGAMQESAFWQIKQYFAEDGVTVNYETIEFLILTTIDKHIFEQQLNELFANPVMRTPLSKNQSTAVSRLREHFFDGF
jgi:hypothetical protein